MKPSKMKRHLTSCHPEHANKDGEFFKYKAQVMKRMRLDADGQFQSQTKSAIEVSYEISLKIARMKKPHTIGEELILPCAYDIVRLLIGEDHVKKLSALPLSNNTVQRRISDMSNDICKQVIEEIKDTPFCLFSLQLDESTDVEDCAQLMAFARYVRDGHLKEEFLFCKSLETTTKALDVFEKVQVFFEMHGIQWGNLCVVCTDGAPSMLGSRSGFQKLVRDKSPTVTGTHCMIHRKMLAAKTLPDILQGILENVIKAVNWIKRRALNNRLFLQLCQEMGADHEVQSNLRDPGSVGPEGARISKITISPWYCPSIYTCYCFKFS